MAFRYGKRIGRVNVLDGAVTQSPICVTRPTLENRVFLVFLKKKKLDTHKSWASL